MWVKEARMKRVKVMVLSMLYGGLLMILLGALVGVWSDWTSIPVVAIRVAVTGVVVWLAGLITKICLEEARVW